MKIVKFYIDDILCVFGIHMQKVGIAKDGGEGSGNFGHSGRPGKIGGSGEGAGNKTDAKSVSAAKTLSITGNEFGENLSDEEVREKAVQYYKDHIAGAKEKNKEIGEVIFSSSGWKKPKSFSADIRKMKIFPILRDIVRTGHVVGTEKDRYNRQNVERFITLETKVHFKDDLNVRVQIRKDSSGKLYYDHYILEDKFANDSFDYELNIEIK